MMIEPRKNKGDKEIETSSLSLLFCGCHAGGQPEEQRFLDLGALLLRLRSSLLLPLSPVPELPF
jgi:hypothetical protein